MLGQTAIYTYDALNRRFRVKNATDTVDYQFDVLSRRAVAWRESADFGIRDSYYWGSQAFAYHALDGTSYYEQQDWLGTERVRTNSAGNTVASYTSLAFGDGFANSSSSDEVPDHFAGTERDKESYTDHSQFRQYQESLGRWMSPDPYDGSYDVTNPQSLNRYSYALNNPLSKTDPSGEDAGEDGCGDDGAGYSGGEYGGGGGDVGGSINIPSAGGSTVVNGGDDGSINIPGAGGSVTVNGQDPGLPSTCNSPDCYGNTGPAAPEPNSGGLSSGSSGGNSGSLQSAPSNGCMVMNGVTVCPSPIDDKFNPMERGKRNYRDAFPICSIHVTIDNQTGETTSHPDLFSPIRSIPSGPGLPNIPLLPFHLVFDGLPDAIYRLTGRYIIPAGRTQCQ